MNFLELEKQLANLGGETLANALPKWLAGEITPHEQNHARATITKKIVKEDGHINWHGDTATILRRILALNPWPGTYSFLDYNGRRERLLITAASVLSSVGDAHHSGEIFIYDRGLAVKTGDGVILIERVKSEGKNEMAAADYLRGHREIVGKILN